MRTIAHVTHEAIYKVGGIGAVLEGLLTSTAYRETEARTILIGPLFPAEIAAEDRLGETGEVLYSSIDGLTKHPVAEKLNHVRREFHVDIVYGHRSFHNPHTGVKMTCEVVLIDTARMHLDQINTFKAGLWEHFGIDSLRYEHSWEYDLYVKLAQPAIACLHALGAATRKGQCVIVAHEFMGLPTAFASMFDPGDAFRTVFHAHEVASVRPIVEHHAGHDVTFYNVLNSALAKERYLDDVFGRQDHYYRHVLIKAAARCDKILAVGDDVERELRFLGPAMADASIEVACNGIPAAAITMEDKRKARERMKDYAEKLIGDRPDYVFTHVTRTVISKGLWRDFRVLEHLEQAFRRTGESAVLFVLSTEMPVRNPDEVAHMEEQWGWPLAHREKDQDLSYGEAIFYAGVQQFNARSRQIKIIYVNQFGWGRDLCGSCMPKDAEFLDIRRGTDVEFGQSIYEPFGIAQLEPLTYGAICVPTKVCGCAGFVERVCEGRKPANVIVADYVQAGRESRTEAQWLAMTRQERHLREVAVAGLVARQILESLPKDEAGMQKMMESGYGLASRMSWDVVASKTFMPAINSIAGVWPRIHVA